MNIILINEFLKQHDICKGRIKHNTVTYNRLIKIVQAR